MVYAWDNAQQQGKVFKDRGEWIERKVYYNLKAPNGIHYNDGQPCPQMSTDPNRQGVATYVVIARDTEARAWQDLPHDLRTILMTEVQP